ncbi:hypothetical protein GQ55_5G333600 [Panicum hallii var. hallii]|uniref:Replication protein A 70 kDa DNA-binding subunit B/D first OB fold domain-containing protein n=1 Tax=Panicum hallii var. hallii TaxID=1504633 RepID=A0A2T7DLX9_9POAL|nr:hypothetical protein GQ55_5G333600 [Panicum hallii var. hallii]
MAYARLREVSPISKNWCIRARVVRMWEHCGGRDGLPPLHVDLVLVDDEGDVMYAEGAGRVADVIKRAVKDSGVCTFTKFLVVNMKPSYRPFCAKYMIKLTPWTKMVSVSTSVDSLP